ncbi:hypothetical protein [Chitinophaga defluvii]|uniref:Lipoprotein n=1 Tax=Chitinophaga defluvii TaxID=3163343 RepID=A0ABV2T3H4_9BACT
MRKFYRQLLAGLLIGLTFFSACSKKDNPVPEVNQEEADAAVFNFILLEKHNDHYHEKKDTVKVSFDKTGHASPHHMHLTEGEHYRLKIVMYYKGKDITKEYTDEGNIHQFFFVPTKEGYLDYVYEDKDAKGRGIGFTGIVKVLKADGGAFDLKAVLKHGLNKDHPAAKAWNNPKFMDAGGETDFEGEFEIHPSPAGPGHGEHEGD